MEGGASKPKSPTATLRRSRRKPRLGIMRRTANARSSSDSSSSDESASPSTHARKRARRTPSAAAAPPSNARPAGVWREARDDAGREVWCLDSDEEEVETKVAVSRSSSDGSDDSDDDEVEFVPTPRPTAGIATKTSPVTKTESAVKVSKVAPVVDLVDSDDSDDEEEEVQQQETPSTQNTTTQEEEEEEDVEEEEEGEGDDKPKTVSGEKRRMLVVEDDDDDDQDEEVEVDEEEDDDDEEEEEWKPESSAAEDETHESDDEAIDDEEEEAENESAVSDSDEEVVIIEAPPRKRAHRTATSAGDSNVSIKMEPVPVVVKTEPVVVAPSAPPAALTPASAPPAATVATPVVASNALKPEPDEEDGASLLLSSSQHDHEAPPPRTRPAQPIQPRGSRPHHHPRAARRSIVRRRRLDDDHAGMLLFDGPQYVPTSNAVKMLIEFIARSIGPVTSHERRWIDYLLLSKLNTAIDRQADEVITRYSDWMKIALGASDDASRARHQVQREPLLPLPIQYTIRPTLPAPTTNGKTKTKSGATPEKQRRAVDTKLIEKRAVAMQAGEKRTKLENQPPRRRPAVGAVTSPNGPFSPTSSITSSVSSRAARASALRDGELLGSHRDLKRQRVTSASPPQGFAFSSPSRALPLKQTPMAYLDLADDANTSGLNRSMPRQWDPEYSRTTPAPLRPLSMNPLYTMSLTELRAHINSVQLDGRAKTFEKPLEIVHKLMTHPRNRHGTFNVPVDPVALNLPTYNDIIKNPMDLGTIKLRLEEGAYLERDDYVADVELVFENAMMFNPPRHSVHVDAEFLLNHFDDMRLGTSSDRLLKRRKKNAQSERHDCRVCFGNKCVMCEQGCLPLAPPHLQCAGSCGVDLRRGAIYYVTRDGTRVWCAKCRANVKTPSDHLARNENGNDTQNKDESTHNGKSKKKKSRGGAPEKHSGAAITPIELPVELTPMKVEADVEPWVKCVRCCRWLHQVCGLYNPVYAAYVAEHEYVCPLCVWKQRSPNAPRNMALLLNADEPPPQKQESSCHQIPKCELSDFIERFLRHKLQKMDHHEAAEQLHVRVLSFPNERLFMPEGVVKSFDENARVLEQLYDKSQHAHRYPSEIGFTSRGIFLFQRHEGTDVCLFTLFVQEYGEECELEANRKSVYVAYLDSIRYLKPPEARTASYHLIMMAYFDYIRRHGFERVHIWSCPPQKRISYVFWCRPPFQRTPSAELLRKWYNSLLRKSQQDGIVKSWTNMYDRYFTALDYSSLPADYEASPPDSNGSMPSVSTRTSTSKSVDPKDHAWPTTLLPPIFDGDFLPAELERILGYLTQRNDKYRRGSRGGKSSSVGTTGGKLAVGEFVTRIKEENTGGSGPVTAQVEFKLRDIFKSCAGSINKLKNDLLVVDLVVPEAFASVRCLPHVNVPAWWQKVPRFFGSRFMFHQLCASATYQFDSLRRAKHSTMMLLHHYFNQRVPQLNVFCNVCCLLIAHADYWHCTSCERFALCDMCHHREGRSHAHALTFGARRRLQPASL